MHLLSIRSVCLINNVNKDTFNPEDVYKNTQKSQPGKDASGTS